MNTRRTRYRQLLVLGLAGWLIAACGGPDGAHLDPEFEVEHGAIIDGTKVTDPNTGMVQVGGCSGTMLTNDYVLTADHCINNAVDEDYGNLGFQQVGPQKSRGYAADMGYFGDVVAAGSAENAKGQNTFVVTRTDAYGNADATFGNNGTAITEFYTTQSESVQDLVVDYSNRVVAVGTGWLNGKAMLTMARLTKSGQLDAGFDEDGKVITELSNVSVYGNAVAMDPYKRIVVAGVATYASGWKIFVARYWWNGQLDTSFGGGGWTATQVPGMLHVGAAEVMVDQYGRVVVGGWAMDNKGSTRFALARFAMNGKLDASFGNKGTVVTNFTSSTGEYVTGIGRDKASRIVVAGTAIVGGEKRIALARYHSNGALDGSFDGDGKVLADCEWGEPSGHGLELDSLDRPVVAAQRNREDGTSTMGVMRFTTAGKSDKTFNFYGQYLEDTPWKGTVRVGSIALSGDRIAIVGTQFVKSGQRIVIGMFRGEQNDAPANSGQRVMKGSQSVPVVHVWRHPTLDVGVLELGQPLSINGSTTGYEFGGFYTGTTASLLGQTVNCLGFGLSTYTSGAGTLRSADLPITHVHPQHYSLGPNADGQITWKGDSGGACFLASKGKLTLTGVQSSSGHDDAKQLVSSSGQVSAEAFRDWVLDALPY